VTVCNVPVHKHVAIPVHFQYDVHFVLFLLLLTSALMCRLASGGSEVNGYVIIVVYVVHICQLEFRFTVIQGGPKKQTIF